MEIKELLSKTDWSKPEIYRNKKNHRDYIFMGKARLYKSRKRDLYIMNDRSDIVIFTKEDFENLFYYIGR